MPRTTSVKSIWRSGTLPLCRAHDGKFPDHLGELLLDPASERELTPNVFFCPASDDTLTLGTPQEIAASLRTPGHCSYVYFGKGLTNQIGKDRVLAVEPLENHDGKGMNVLYGDAHADWVGRPEADQLLMSLGFERVDPPSGRPDAGR